MRGQKRGAISGVDAFDGAERGIGVTGEFLDKFRLKLQTFIQPLPIIRARHFVDHRGFYQRVAEGLREWGRIVGHGYIERVNGRTILRGI